MTRVIAYRIGVAILACAGFVLLWSLAYEIVVAARWAPHRFPGEGASRWALLRMQNADRSVGFALIAAKHCFARVIYPATRAEALIRAGLAAGAVVALGAGGWLFAVINRRQMPFGEARFGTLMEAARQGLTGKQGIVLGMINGVTLRSDEPAHILVVGPSRSGKGTGFVLPNGYLWQGSAVFFDPKRENFAALAHHREAMGNKVFMFSPGSNDTHRYNPLDFVRRDERMATDCLVVASFIIPEKADDTWAGAGRLLLSALIGYVLSSPLIDGAQHKRNRPALPRDAFRTQRGGADHGGARDPLPVVVTPDYGDRASAIASAATALAASGEAHRDRPVEEPFAPRSTRMSRRKDADVGRNPFDAYGERSSSRPYALRLPDPIDLVLRQMAAEERTFPLRIIDRILYDHLKKIGRLPPPRGT